MKQNELSGCRVHVENVGGITESTIKFSPGVTILAGRNATNRTSMLQAIMAGLGSDAVNVKADADEAVVDLELNGETYMRTLSKQSGSIVSNGEQYLDDPELANLFAFLLESNEARRAVARGDDLRDLIMRPIDTAEINTEIDRLRGQRTEIEQELEEIEDLKGDLPTLEEERTQLNDRIKEMQTELKNKEEELDTADRNVEETREEKDELETKLEELRKKRSKLEDIRYDVETEQESLTQLREERREVEAKLEELPETPAGEIEEIDQRIERLRSQKQDLERDVNRIQSVIGFNEEMLEGADSETFTAKNAEAVTDQLLPGDKVTCWTCGSTVNEEQIEETLEYLREQSQEKFSEVRSLDDEIDELDEQRREYQQSQRERERTERRLDELTSKIESSKTTIEQLQDRRDELIAAVETVEAAVEDLQQDDYGEILDLHKEANQLEHELGKLEAERDRIIDEITSIEAQIDEADDLQSRLEEIRERMEELRTKIERIEEEAIEQFNEHMNTVLDILDYENLDRIWLERVEREVRDGRRKVSKSVFELHVVRSSASGAVYEDTIAHLSESEREVTGLVFALAGYLAHELYETVPVMLLDSLEAIDGERIAALVEYFSDYTGYLVAALLEEDATKLDDSYQRITDI